MVAMSNMTFQVTEHNDVLFESDQRWLYPLFDLEAYLDQHILDLSGAEIHDKVVGKAAALLIARLGAGSVHAHVLSKLGQSVFDAASLPYTYGTLVERIDCQTEELLKEVDDPEQAYLILKERAHR